MPAYPTEHPPGWPHIDLPEGWQYVPDLSKAVAVSGNAPVQVGSGRFQMAIPGGAATAHPSTGVYAVFPMFDVFKNAIGWGTVAPFTPAIWMMELEFHTEPSLTSDTYVRIGFSDEPSIAPANYGGVDTEMQWTGGAQLVTAGIELHGNGNAFRTPWGGATGNANKFVRGSIGALKGSTVYRPSVHGLNSSRADTGELAIYVYDPPMTAGSGGGYIYIAGGKTSAVAGAAFVDFTARFWAMKVGTP